MCKWGTMSSLPVNVAVFFGKVDKRPPGWYWTPISEGQIPNSGSIAGPFETKAAAVKDARQAAIIRDTGGNDHHKRKGFTDDQIEKVTIGDRIKLGAVAGTIFQAGAGQGAATTDMPVSPLTSKR